MLFVRRPQDVRFGGLGGGVICGEDRNVSWLQEVQAASAAGIDSKSIQRAFRSLLLDGNDNPIKSRDQWEERRRELLAWWRNYLQPFPVQRTASPEIEVIEEERKEGLVRQRVQYEVEPGVMTEAYIVRPAHLEGAAPGVAVFHSTVDHSICQPAGVEGKPEKAFGWSLAKAGCVTISPRNFLWPTNHKIAAQQETERFQRRRPGITGMAKMLHDAQVAIDILAARDDVDVERLGAVGHSLGAKEVLYLAAFDERIKVTVSSEGGIGTTFSNWNAPWYLGPDIVEAASEHEHHELLAAVAPRAFLLIGGDSADGSQSWPFVEAALPVYQLYGGHPRVGLFNHKQGHAVPPEAEQRIAEWFATYL